MDKELISSSIYLKKIIKRSFSSKSHRRYWCNNRKEVAMLPIFLWFFNCKLSLANLPSRFLLAFKCIFIRVLTEEHLSRSSHGLFLWSDRVTFGFASRVQSLIERIEWLQCKSERGRQNWAFDGILIVSLDAPCFLHVNMARQLTKNQTCSSREQQQQTDKPKIITKTRWEMRRAVGSLTEKSIFLKKMALWNIELLTFFQIWFHFLLQTATFSAISLWPLKKSEFCCKIWKDHGLIFAANRNFANNETRLVFERDQKIESYRHC